MAFAQLDVHFDETPSNAELELEHLGAYACSIAYCNRNLTDGYFPERALRTFGKSGCSPEVAAQMVELGKWVRLPDGRYRIRSFRKWNPLRRDVLKKRQATAERVADWRRKRSGDKEKAHDPVTAYVPTNVRAPDTDQDPQQIQDLSEGARAALPLERRHPGVRKPAANGVDERARGRVLAAFRIVYEETHHAKPVTDDRAASGATALLRRLDGDVERAIEVVQRAVRMGTVELHTIAGGINRFLSDERPRGSGAAVRGAQRNGLAVDVEPF